MQSWKIFTHSLRMIFDNLGAVLKISAVLYIAQFIVVSYFMLSYGNVLQEFNEFSQNADPARIAPEIPAGFASSMLLTVGIFLVTSMWIAVMWHRYILSNECLTTFLPPFHPSEIIAYLGKTILLGLIMVVVYTGTLLIAGLVIGILAPVLSQSILDFLFGAVLGTSVLYFSYRFSPVLPGAALAKPIKFREAWVKTAPASGVILLLAVIIVAFTQLVQIPSLFNPDPTSAINIAYEFVLGWIVMLLGVSILTTLYGIYVEGREL